MTSVRDPTYFLAPNWTFRPDGPIALGNIVADPLRPQYVLSRQTEPLPATDNMTETDWSLAIEKIQNSSVNIWTPLFQQLKLDFSANRQKMGKVKITMDSLETVYFTDDPVPEAIRERVNETRVRSLLRADSIFRRPVYMVTGLKIARGFHLIHYDSSEHGIHTGGGVEVAPAASVGGNVGLAIMKSVSEGFKSSSDIIFAYQLIRIKPRGWGKNSTFETVDFRHKEAFLAGENRDEEEAEKEVEIEVDEPTIEGVVETQRVATVVELCEDQYAWLI